MNATKRTEAILANFKGNADEFAMLKGLLCMEIGPGRIDYKEYGRVSKFIDTQLIAQRMDEMNREAIAAIRAGK
jgi:hypothetical protein